MAAPYRTLYAYVVAVTSVLVVIAVRAALAPVLGDVAPVILFMIPVAFSAWFGGLGPGLLATLLGGPAGIALFTSPGRTTPVEHGLAFFWLARGVPFLIVGVSISLLADLAERARRRALANEHHALRSESALRRNEETQRRIFESVTDFSIFTTDLVGVINTWTVGAERLFGYGEAEAIGKPAAMLFTPEDCANHAPERELASARRTGRGSDDRWHVRKDGTRFFASGVVTPLRDEGGAIVGFTKVARDVTAQQEAQHALLEARRRSDAALLAAEMGTYEWDMVADRVYGDENFARIFDVRLDESNAAKVGDYLAAVHPDDRERVRAAVQQIVDGDVDFSAEYRIHAGEHQRWVLARGRGERDESGRVILLPGVVIDVTEQRRIGEALRQQQDRYRTLFDSIDDGFCIIDVVFDDAGRATDYRFTEINQTFERQTGLHNAAGKMMRDLIPDQEEHWFQIYGRVARTGRPERFVEEARQLGRWFDVYACRVGGQESRQIAVLFSDVTAKRQAEQERERLLASETQAREAAERASHAKDEFLATISHELRTPLSAITGWAGLLQQVKHDPKMLDEGLDVIARNAGVQAQLIEDILDVSRITSGKLRLNVRQIDVRQPIDAAIDTVANAARAKNVAIETRGFDAPTHVAGDPERLQQVFWNLLANAIKFSESGGRITVELSGSAVGLTAIVRDTGSGIEREFLPFVFERFRQADMSSTRRQGGLGLGLSIVRHLVELHGGSVAVESDGPGRGSAFRVDLPLAAAPREPVAAAPPSARRVADIDRDPLLDGRRVLVLDDEPDARRVIEVVLTQCGVGVTVVGSVADALGVLTGDHEYDAVISDIGMPDEDGYAFVRRLKDLQSRGIIRRVPLAALTAYTRESDKTAVLAAGFDHFLAKPIKPADLLRTVTRMVESRTVAR